MATDPWADFLPGKPQPDANDPWAEFMPAKERAWSDVPLDALKNIGPSAVNFAKNIVQPILHPVDTHNSLQRLAEGVVAPPSWLIQETPEQKDARVAPAKAAGQFFADRYGSAEGIKNTLATDPVGVAGDLASILAPAAAVTRGTAVGGQLARIAATIDPVTGAARAAGVAARAAEPVLSHALGFSTGAGADAVRAAGRAGTEGNQVFVNQMRGNAPASDIVDTAQDAIATMRQERGQNYQQGMAPVRADQTVLDFAPIDRAANQAAEVGTFNGVPLARSTADTQARIAEILSEWRNHSPDQFHTAAGFDALKRTIGDVRDSTQFGTPSRVYADRVYRAVGNEVRAQVPEYAATMDTYRGASDQLDELTRTLSLGDKATTDTSLRKLGSVMRNNVQTNYGERARLVDVLAQHQPDLPYAIAGQSLNSPIPRGLVARAGGAGTAAAALHFMDPSRLALGATQSPRAVGEAAYLAGRGAGGTARLADALGVNAQNVGRVDAAANQAGRMSSQEIQRRIALLLMRANEQGGGNSLQR